MNEVTKRLKAIISQQSMAICQPQNKNLDNKSDTTGKNVDLDSIRNPSYGDLSQFIRNFDRMSTKEIIESLTPENRLIIDKNSLSEKDLDVVVNEIVIFIFK